VIILLSVELKKEAPHVYTGLLVLLAMDRPSVRRSRIQLASAIVAMFVAAGRHALSMPSAIVGEIVALTGADHFAPSAVVADVHESAFAPVYGDVAVDEHIVRVAITIVIIVSAVKIDARREPLVVYILPIIRWRRLLDRYSPVDHRPAHGHLRRRRRGAIYAYGTTDRDGPGGYKRRRREQTHG
jgi:hypothetical protein